MFAAGGKRTVWRGLAGASLLAVACAASAQAVSEQGQRASEQTLRQVRDIAPVRIGGQVLRPVPDAGSGASARSGAAADGRRATPVVRERDQLVGVSYHELSVTGAEPAQVAALAASLLPGAEVRTFPELGLTMIRTARFADLQPLARGIAESLPQARVDLPVRWAPVRPR